MNDNDTQNGVSDYIRSTFGAGMPDAVELEYELAGIAAEAHRIACESNLSRRQIAERMGHASPSTVQRLLKHGEAHNATLETMMRFARACGHRMLVRFVLERPEFMWTWHNVPCATEPARMQDVDDVRRLDEILQALQAIKAKEHLFDPGAPKETGPSWDLAA